MHDIRTGELIERIIRDIADGVVRDCRGRDAA